MDDLNPTLIKLAHEEESPDSDWHMNPCKMGHTDVGAASGIAMCNTCEESIKGATTQEAFEDWNQTHPSKKSYCSEFWLKEHLQREFALIIWGRLMSAQVLDNGYRRQVGPVCKAIIEFRGQPASVTAEWLACLLSQALWILSKREDTQAIRRLDKAVIERLKAVLNYAEENGIVTPINSRPVKIMSDALEKIIEMNRQYALDKYGDAERAESMACVTLAREALKQAKDAQ